MVLLITSASKLSAETAHEIGFRPVDNQHYLRPRIRHRHHGLPSHARSPVWIAIHFRRQRLRTSRCFPVVHIPWKNCLGSAANRCRCSCRHCRSQQRICCRLHLPPQSLFHQQKSAPMLLSPVP